MNSKKAITLGVVIATIVWSVAPFGLVGFARAQEGCNADALKSVKSGQKGAAVMNLQSCLEEWQSGVIPAGATGFYGGQTVKAVKAFYKEVVGMAWNGKSIGSKGISAMKDALAGTSMAVPPTGTKPPTGTGSTGTSNSQLTQLLKGLGLSDAQIAAIVGAVGAPATPATPATPAAGAVATQPAAMTGNVSVALSPNNAGAGTIIAGGAQNPTLTVRVSNGTNAAVTVTGMNFKKQGVVSDSNISNGYISVGSNIIAQYQGLTSGLLTFSGNIISIPAGQSIDLTLRLDIGSGTSNGNTIGFSLTSMTLSSGTVSDGSLPIVGNYFTVSSVSNPSLATFSGTYQTVASSVDAGTNGFRASAMNVTVNNSPVRMLSVRYTVTGSLNLATDLANLALKVDGTQVGTSTMLSADGKAFFDLSGSNVVVNTGSHQLEVFTDILGTPNRTMKLEVLRPYDWVLTDTQYNTNISGGTPSGSATSVSVRAGTATVALSADTPTGNIPLGATNITIGKFTYRASGEAVKVKWLPFKLTEAGSVAAWSTGTNVDADIRNIALYDEVGNQIGTTINTPSSCTYGTVELTATTYICSFGSPTSNINYIVPGNTTRVLSLRADVQSGADMTSLKGSLLAPSGTSGFTGSNNEGQISFQTSAAPGGTIDGSNLTIVTAPFTAGQNSSLSNQRLVGGSYNAKIASFSIGASSAEGVNLTSLTVRTSANVNDGTAAALTMQNLVAKVGNTTLNYTVPTIALSSNYTFSVPAGKLLIPAGGTIIVDVYGDVLQNSSTTTFTAPLRLLDAVGVGATTNTNQTLKDSSGNTVSALNSSTGLAGQNLTIAGAGALTVAPVSNDPVSTQFRKGQTGITLAKFQLRETTNNETIRIVNLGVTASSTNSTASASPWSNLKLVTADSNAGVPIGTLIAGPLAMTVTSGIGTVTFSPVSTFSVPANGVVNAALVGDVSSDETFFFNNNNTAWVFNVASTSNISAVGVSSAASIVVTGTGSGTNSASQSALAAKLTLTGFDKLTGATLNNADVRAASITVRNDGSSYSVLKQVKVTFAGSALQTTTPATSTITLYDQDASTVLATTSIAYSSSTFSGIVATLNLSTSTTNGQVQAGAAKTFYLGFVPTTLVTQSTSNQNPVVTMQIGASSALTDITYATYTTQPNFTESINLDRTQSLPKSVTVSYQ